VRRAPSMLPREGRLERVALGPADKLVQLSLNLVTEDIRGGVWGWSEFVAVDGLAEERRTSSSSPHPSSKCGSVHSLRQIFRWGSDYELESLEADEAVAAEGDEPAEVPAAADDESGKYDPDRRAPSSSRTRSRPNALPSRHIAATTRLRFRQTHVTASPSVFGTRC
jgi:hypothetical protein